jgi:hypothetical protein
VVAKVKGGKESQLGGRIVVRLIGGNHGELDQRDGQPHADRTKRELLKRRKSGSNFLRLLFSEIREKSSSCPSPG